MSDHPNAAGHKRRAVLLAVVGLGFGILLVGGIFLAVTTYQLVDAVRDTQVANTERQELDRKRDEQTAQTADDAARSAERIEDCTTPGRDCFERNSRATSDAVAGINQGTLAVIVAALSCQADGIVGQRTLARCTVERARDSRPR